MAVANAEREARSVCQEQFADFQETLEAARKLRDELAALIKAALTPEAAPAAAPKKGGLRNLFR